jgi:hypothetical protein
MDKPGEHTCLGEFLVLWMSLMLENTLSCTIIWDGALFFEAVSFDIHVIKALRRDIDNIYKII